VSRHLLKGNEAITEAAIAAGCKFYAGYPITPQNELTSSMAERMPQSGGVFIQAESELAAVNLVFGAAVCGARAMTSTSSPGFSLMQESVSYLAAGEVSCVLVNVSRGGPGLGNIQSSQADYFQAVKGGGHGDYHNIVLSPSTVEETFRQTLLAFDLADKYRAPVVMLVDGLLGQLMEPVDVEALNPHTTPPKRDWALDGAKGRPPRRIQSLLMDDGVLEKHNYHLAEKYQAMQSELLYEMDGQEESELFVVAYGSTARACREAMKKARSQGTKMELLRPITLYPFPTKAIREAASRAKNVLVVEMSLGQMVEDVRLAVGDVAPVHFFGRPGGAVPDPTEIYQAMQKALGGKVRA
jgi:2-oxoglutarate ferredoxin oxidoreductase subunit alpha